MKLSKLILLLLALVIVVGCKDRGNSDSPYLTDFAKEKVKGLYVNGQKTFVYNDTDHQMSSNSRKTTFRYQTHSQDVYLNMTLSKSSPAVAEVLTVTVDSKGIQNFESGDYVVKVLKKATANGEELMWLWCNDKNTGFVIADMN